MGITSSTMPSCLASPTHTHKSTVWLVEVWSSLILLSLLSSFFFVLYSSSHYQSWSWFTHDRLAFNSLSLHQFLSLFAAHGVLEIPIVQVCGICKISSKVFLLCCSWRHLLGHFLECFGVGFSGTFSVFDCQTPHPKGPTLLYISSRCQNRRSEHCHQFAVLLWLLCLTPCHARVRLVIMHDKSLLLLRFCDRHVALR